MKDTTLLRQRHRLLGEHSPLFYDRPLQLVRGEGVWVYDAQGRRYLDAYNNVSSLGHCHPEVVQALCEQSALLNTNTRYLHENIVRYGQALTGSLDKSLSRVFFCCSGSEANDLALRLLRLRKPGGGVICTKATYHGNSAAVDALSTMMRRGRTSDASVKAVDYPQTYRPLKGVPPEQLAEAYAAQVSQAIAEFKAEGRPFAGMLICPIFANEGLPDVPAGYLERVARIVRAAGGRLVFDEVQSGFGRTGRLWGHQGSGVVPDIMTLGKPMGNGHPLAAVLCREELAEAFQSQVMYFNTFGGNPVSCAVGLAVWQVIARDQLVRHAKAMGAFLKQGLQALALRHECLGDVRGQGMFYSLELVSHRQRKSAAPQLAHRVVELMREQGVLLGRIGMQANQLKLRPALVYSQDNVNHLVNALDQALLRAQQERL